jgi:hypothetical protein
MPKKIPDRTSAEWSKRVHDLAQKVANKASNLPRDDANDIASAIDQGIIVVKRADDEEE